MSPPTDPGRTWLKKIPAHVIRKARPNGIANPFARSRICHRAACTRKTTSIAGNTSDAGPSLDRLTTVIKPGLSSRDFTSSTGMVVHFRTSTSTR